MTSPTSVTRNSEWIAREYGREKWPAVLSRIEADLCAGETDLSRVVNRVKRWESGLAEEKEREFVVAGRALRLPGPFALHGGVGWMAEKLLALADGADAIIELGSGWGFNLFNLWLYGGPRGARYFALEYTEAGRSCTERLAALQPDLAITTLPFDYHAVDLASLGRFSGRVFVYTCFSIDQIPHLSAAVYLALRKLADRVDGMHFEPAGWQMDGERCVGSSHRYAEQHDYNRNLWSLLNQLQEEGILRIEAHTPELFGQNPENSASMIYWTMDAS
ncbi:MAG: hypothetical protein M3O41_17195 [Pseudomonadota bacterium]|nr:hypothetical protein [Pseudomonadota bacterium]